MERVKRTRRESEQRRYDYFRGSIFFRTIQKEKKKKEYEDGDGDDFHILFF